MESEKNKYLVQFENDLFSFSAISNIGDREEQQDTVGYMFIEDRGFVAVCDGMGGHTGGQLASKTATAQFLDEFEKMHIFPDAGAFLKDTAVKIDAQLHQLTDSNDLPLGAGTTVVGVLLLKDQLSWISIGDSRIYFNRGNELVQVTQDHVYQMVLDNRYTSGEISHDAYVLETSKGEALISFLGIGNIEIIDYNQIPFELKKDDKLLLASDGLYKYLSFESIRDVILNFTNTTEALQVLDSLIEKESKIHNLSRDNMTAAIIKVK